LQPIKCFDISGHAGGAIALPGFGTVHLVTSDNNQRHQPFLPITGVVAHWTGLDITDDCPVSLIHMTVFAAYHWGIVDNGVEAAIVRTLRPEEKGQHAWGRNTNLAGMSYAATADGSLPNYGPGAPTPRQRIAKQTLMGEFCAWHHLDPRGTVLLDNKGSDGRSIWTVPGRSAFPVLMSHQTLAIPDGYGSERWDTGKLIVEDRAAAIVVYDQLKGKPLPDGTKRQFMFAAWL
jgi:hypothetical protein